MSLTCKRYHQKGWSPATSTNYSFRLEDDLNKIYVSKSGIDKSQFTENDFMEVDFDGKPYPEFEGIRPSAETLIHCNENTTMAYDVKLPIKFPTGEVIEAGINIRPYAR